MKRLLFVCIAALVFNACTKDREVSKRDNGTVTGKWAVIQRYMSNGSVGTWNEVPEADRFWINFGADGTLTYSSNFPKKDSAFNRYTYSPVVGDLNNPVRVSSTLNSKKDAWYTPGSENNQLVLSIFTCIEGCAYKFSATK